MNIRQTNRPTRRTAAGLPVLLLVTVLLLAACGDGTKAEATTWQVEGPLLAWDAGVWIVDSIPIVVPATIQLNGDVILGSIVTATGTFDEAGQRVADSIEIEPGSRPESTLSGVTLSGTIEQIDGTRWTIGGQQVIVAGGTQITSAEPGVDLTVLFQIGNQADVDGNRLSDGRIVARSIALRLPESAEAAAPTTAPSPEPPQATSEAPAVDDSTNETDTNGATDDDADTSQPDADHDNSDEQSEKPENPDKQDKPEKSDKHEHKDNGNDDGRKKSGR